MLRRVVVALALLAAVAGTVTAKPKPLPPPPPPPVEAPPPPPAPPEEEKPWARGVSAERQAAALALFKDGNAFFVESQYALALEKYRLAITSWDHPAIRYNMVVCLVNLDQPVEANENLALALAYGAAPLGPELHAQALTYQKLLLGQLAQIKISCVEPGAELSLDGQLLFTGPGEATRMLRPGQHQLVASKAGFLTVTQTLVLLPGQPTIEEVRLVSLKAATRYERRWPTWKPWAVVGAGAGIALLGVPLQILAASDFDQYDDAVTRDCSNGGCTQATLPSSTASLRTRARVENVVAISLFSVGAATALGGAVWAFLNQPRAVEPRQPAAPRVSVVPIAGGAFVGLDGSF